MNRTTAALDLSIWRNDAVYEYPLRIIGPNLTGVSLRAQFRLAADTSGPAIAALETVTNSNAEGVRLAGAVLQDGRYINDLRIRINKSTRQSMPYMGELGDAAVLAWGLQIDGRTRIQGSARILAHVMDSDGAPTSRLTGYGFSAASASVPASGATLTISQDGGSTLVIDGADLVTGQVDRAAAAAASAEQDAQAAEMSAQVAIAAGRWFKTRAEGEAGSNLGQLFSSGDGAGNVIYYEKTAGGSYEIGRAVTPAGLAAATGAGLVAAKQRGAGAVVTPLLAKFYNDISPNDYFGIVGDPEQPNAELGVQAAMDDAIKYRKTVFLDGLYRIDNTLLAQNLFAGGLSIRGRCAWGHQYSGIGAVLIANTGGRAVIDTLGSQFLCFSDFVIDGGVFNPPNPSHQGILFGRSAEYQYAQEHTLRNILINLPHNPAANGGYGTVGIVNVASEIADYDSIYVLATNPVMLTSGKPAWLYSNKEFSDFSSMSMVNFRGKCNLVGLGPLGIGLDMRNAFAITAENLYVTGTGANAIRAVGTRGIDIRGHREGFDTLLFLDGAKNTRIAMSGVPNNNPPIQLPAVYTSVDHLKLELERNPAWYPIIQSGYEFSRLNGIFLEMDSDTGEQPLTNVNDATITNVIRDIANGERSGRAGMSIADFARMHPIFAGNVPPSSFYIDVATGNPAWKAADGTVKPILLG
ncbi:hypothetical protein NF699_09535 [Sphingomonadaceae bacterium OTU29LAMAA1]|nr:hypothetical protein NF699_09535 [Sphingomonadaceae bacterium OTU29LAMAA1]